MKSSEVQTQSFYSRLLNKEMKMNVYVPAANTAGQTLPVLYFLHGRNGGPHFIFETGMHQMADMMIETGKIRPLFIVFPQMDNSHGLNSAQEYQEFPDPVDNRRMIHLGMYEDYFLKEVMGFIESRYNIAPERGKRYIGGVSAGGYGALHIAFHHPELFFKIGGHMPALELELEEEDKPYYPNMQFWLDNDPINIAKYNDLAGLEVYLDCGDHDQGQFYKGCALLRELLAAKGVKIQNHIFKGEHNLAYIRSNIEKYLVFYGS
jgi:enterochelin esterase-like enzyme